MTISATTQGLRPGVCTSSNRPATPFEGQMIYETDTDLTYVYGGSAWQQVAGGTAVGNSGLVYVKSQTIGSAVTTVTVTDAFSSTYDNYRIIVNGGTATATYDFNLRIGTSTTGYYLTSLYNAFDNGTAQGLQLSNQDAWRYFGAGTSDSLQADIEVMQPNLAKKTMASARMISATTTGLSMFSQGWLNNTTQHTQFVLFPSAGTWTGGTITVYGYRKA